MLCVCLKGVFEVYVYIDVFILLTLKLVKKWGNNVDVNLGKGFRAPEFWA